MQHDAARPTRTCAGGCSVGQFDTALKAGSQDHALLLRKSTRVKQLKANRVVSSDDVILTAAKDGCVRGRRTVRCAETEIIKSTEDRMNRSGAANIQFKALAGTTLGA